MTQTFTTQRCLLALAIGLAACMLPAAEPSSISPPSPSPAPAPTSIRVCPPDVNLTNARDRQSVIVQSVFADGITQDVTDQVTFSLADPSFARLESNLLTPIADGTTELKVEFAGHSTTLPVVVKDAGVSPPISFKLDVMPVFMRAGCNTGSCHGAARGKDGFMLSLFGYDPNGDHFRITRQVPGRRINLAIPEESLLIQKSVGAVPHTGGKRFDDGQRVRPNAVAVASGRCAQRSGRSPRGHQSRSLSRERRA